MRTYLDEVGDRIRAHVSPEYLPGGDTGALFRLYAVLLLGKGAHTTIEDVHNAWSAWMADRQPDHEAIRPYEELDKATRNADRPFLDAIRGSADDFLEPPR